MEKGEIEKLCRENHIDLLVLFGSRAKKGGQGGSDFDLALKPSRGWDIDKLGLIYQLGELFDTDNVDLVILTPDTDPVLLWEIFIEGQPLYENMAGLFESERLRAWKIYLDTEQLRFYQTEYLKKFIKKAKDVARGLK